MIELQEISLCLKLYICTTKGFILDSVNDKKNLNKATGILVIKNDRGLHTRPSTEVVKCSASFKSDIKLTYKKTTVNGRSLLGILMLAAEKGAKIKITAQGEDAQAAVDALLSLGDRCFNIKY